MLEFIIGVVIGAAFADFWKHIYYKTVTALKEFMNKPKRKPLPKGQSLNKGNRSKTHLNPDIINWFRNAHKFKTPHFKLPKNLSDSQRNTIDYLHLLKI